jgi:hypothetical protein
MKRKPDYKLKALDKFSGRKNNDLGAAWKNEDGSISIVLNPCVQISSNADLVLNLFPRDENFIENVKKKKKSKRMKVIEELEVDSRSAIHDESEGSRTSFDERDLPPF